DEPTPRRLTVGQAMGTRVADAREPATAVRPILPGLRLPCPFCRQSKHFLESLCPHCRRPDLLILGLWALVGGAALVAASLLLPLNEPGLPAVGGALAAGLAALALPTATGLLVTVVAGYRQPHTDAGAGVHWPATKLACARCGRVNVMPLFVCRSCGHVS